MPVIASMVSFLCFLLIMNNSVEADEFNPRVVIRRALPAITKPKFLDAEAASKIVSDEELVLGLTIKGKSRAYPINMLTGPRREIINDELNGTAIAATW